MSTIPAELTPDTYAERLYDMLAPLAARDSEVEWALLTLCNSIGIPFQLVEDLVRDTPDGVGWSTLLDLERCPDEALPWLAQFVGVRVLPNSTPEDQRARIASTDGFKRGTRDALIGAARATLVSLVNPLANASFETSGAWTAWGDPGVSLVKSNEQAHSGSYSGKITTSATGVADGAHNNVATGIVPGQVLRFSAYVRPIVPLGLRLQAHCYPAGSIAVSPVVVCPAGLWTQLSLTFTVGPNVDNIYYIVSLGGTPIATTYYIDDGLVERLSPAPPAPNVVFRERDGDKIAEPIAYAYRLSVSTYASQTPNPTATLAALLAQKPAGIVLDYHVSTGQDYVTLKSGTASYATMKTKYPDYIAVVTDEP